MSDSTSTPDLPLEQQLDNLFSAHNRSDAPGLVVGISHAGKTIFRKAYGLASVQHGVANTPNTRMRIGSTSKHFTCLAALLLAEDGKLDLDIPATEYLPELPAHKTVPTLRQFMTHTSGYRCALDVSTAFNGDARQPMGWSLKALAGQVDYNFEPNQGQMYCNGGYHLLSIAIDRAAGMPMETFKRERIFAPLGMTNTQCVPSDNDFIPGMAALHLPRADGGWKRGAFMTDDIRGEGNMISTVDDMLRWLAHMNGPKIVGSEDSWRQMFERPTLANGLKSVYSLGLQRHDYRGVEVLHHGGSVIGGNSQMLCVPAHDLNIAIMANGALVSTQELAKAVVDVVLAQHLSGEKPVVAPFASFRNLKGARYHGRESGVLIGFDELGDRLGFSFQGSPMMPILRAEQGGLFAGFQDVALGPLLFTDLGNSTDSAPPGQITYSESGNTEILDLLGQTQPSSAELALGLTGDFHSRDFGALATITQTDGELLMTVRGDYSAARQYRLEPVSDIALIIHSVNEPGAASSMTIRRTADGLVTDFDVDLIRARHLRFVRS